MDQIAEHAGLGMGTLYRHFPNKQALLTAIVGERFKGITELARAAEAISDPGQAYEAVLRSYLEAADGDLAYQLALMGSNAIDWDGVKSQKAEFIEIVTRITERAVKAGSVRGDLTYNDYRVITSGVMSSMYFNPGDDGEWRRHLEIVLDGILRNH